MMKSQWALCGQYSLFADGFPSPLCVLCPHFTAEKVEAQRGETACPGHTAPQRQNSDE